MSTQTPPMPYPNLLNWFKGSAPDTADIAAELTEMSASGAYQHLLTQLRLHGELSSFQSALQVAFPQFTVAAPQFPLPRKNLPTLDRATLQAAGVSCLIALSLGGAPEAFSAKHFSWKGGSLCYQEVPVFATVLGKRERLLVGSGDRLYVAGPDHPLKGWVQRAGKDVTLQEITAVLPDDHESGYNAVNAEHTVIWQCSFGDLTTPKGLIDAISKSEVFGQIQWIPPYCTAGWVASLMPTLSSRGTIAIPGGGQAVIGQNVHSTQVVGSAWLEGVTNVDCKQADFPAYWTAGVVATLCPHAGTHPDFRNIVVFCDLLKQKSYKPVGAKGTRAELVSRITFLVGAHKTYRALLLGLPNIGDYYKECF